VLTLVLAVYGGLFSGGYSHGDMTLSLCLGESVSCQGFTSIFYNSRHHTSLSIGTPGCLPVALSLGVADFPQSALVTSGCRSVDPHGFVVFLPCGLGSLWCPNWCSIRPPVGLCACCRGVLLWDGSESLVRADFEQASVQAGTQVFQPPADLRAYWRAGGARAQRSHCCQELIYIVIRA
jgi:hypothetical protein